MRINSLTVKNFKGFEEATFEFPERFTLIVGENGTGKTSVLEAIALSIGTSLGWSDLGLGKYWSVVTGRDLTNADTSSSFDPFDSCCRVARIQSGRVIRLERCVPNQIQMSLELGAAVIGVALDESGVPSVRVKNATEPHPWHLRDTLLAASPHPVLASYFSARLPMQRWTELRERVSNSHVGFYEAYFDSLYGRFAIGDILRWLRDEQYAALQEGKESVLFKTVTDAMVSCLPGAKRITYVIREYDVLVEFENGNVQPFRNLSDGQRMLLWMVADIAYRAAWLNPQLEDRVLQETDGIVLIDELDLHLHPKWQRDVIDNLKKTFPKVQFIATSHSPFLIQSLQPGELLSLDGEPLIDYSNSGLEEIARFIQGVETPHTSQRYADQKAAAKRYFTMLREGRSRNDKELLEAKSNLDSLTAHFSDNPAAEAFFELQRAAQANSIASESTGDSEDPPVEATSP